MMNAPVVYGYARVSSISQNEDRQIMALKEMGVPETNIYVDKMSGKNFDRPEYKKLIKKLHQGVVLYVKSIDRLGRSYSEIGEQWRIITKEQKADVCVIDMPALDTRREKNLLGTFISDIILALLSYCSDNELNLIHQRQREGIEAARANGVRLGRPPKPLPENFHDMCKEWSMGRISATEAARQCGIPESTFRYKARKCRQKSSDEQ